MAEERALVLEPDGDEVWAYRPATAALEAELAAQVAALLGSEPVLKLPGEPPPADVVPAPEQAAAVRAAFASRLSVVTGGPGTGKTATIKLICAAAAAQKASVLLVAPDRPRGPADGGVDGPRRVHRPLRARLDPRARARPSRCSTRGC